MVLLSVQTHTCTRQVWLMFICPISLETTAVNVFFELSNYFYVLLNQVLTLIMLKDLLEKNAGLKFLGELFRNNVP